MFLFIIITIIIKYRNTEKPNEYHGYSIIMLYSHLHLKLQIQQNYSAPSAV